MMFLIESVSQPNATIPILLHILQLTSVLILSICIPTLGPNKRLLSKDGLHLSYDGTDVVAEKNRQNG